MESSEISDGFQDLVRGGGDRVDIHTAVCVEWNLAHDNCRGCISELGCSKAVAMLGVSISPMMYEPKDYDDYERMHHSMQSKLDRLLNAKTTKEVQSISW